MERVPARNSILPAILLAAMAVPGLASALEFSATFVAQIDGRRTSAIVYHRDGSWRLEHDRGSVLVTIARLDTGMTWLLRSDHRVQTIPYESTRLPPVALSRKELSGEISRSVLGTEDLRGHRTTVYAVQVRSDGRPAQIFYQWYAEDLGIPLRLVRQHDDWIAEYVDLRVRPISDVYFNLPLTYAPLDAPPTAE